MRYVAWMTLAVTAAIWTSGCAPKVTAGKAEAGEIGAGCESEAECVESAGCVELWSVPRVRTVRSVRSIRSLRSVHLVVCGACRERAECVECEVCEVFHAYLREEVLERACFHIEAD